MFKNPWFLFSMLVFLFMGSCVYMITSTVKHFGPAQEMALKENSILYLKLDGVILDAEDLLENLRKYVKEDKIKGVVIRVNSPGGVVGPSQELYTEIKRVKEEYNKPIIISASAIMASGAYYAAAAADKIFVNSGTLMGSIGVIMEFANLSKLYEWAKIDRYSLQTGKYKNTGTDTRAMREDEKEYLQSLINEVQEQFKTAVSEGRELAISKVEPYADGRVFTGSTGVRLGFADKVASLQEAFNEVGEMTGLGKNPKIFYPRKPKEELLEFLGRTSWGGSALERLEKQLALDLIAKPLYIYPAYLGDAFGK